MDAQAAVLAVVLLAWAVTLLVSVPVWAALVWGLLAWSLAGVLAWRAFVRSWKD